MPAYLWTGQVFCYDSKGALVPCMNSGQDGEFQTGIPWPAERFVPDGEVVRCWLPYPKMGIPRSSKVELLEIDGDVMNIAPTTVDQRSVYLEKKREVMGETTMEVIKFYQDAGLQVEPGRLRQVVASVAGAVQLPVQRQRGARRFHGDERKSMPAAREIG